MLHITSNQLELLQTEKLKLFYPKALVYLHEYFLVKMSVIGTQAEQLQWVEDVCHTASEYEFEREGDIYSFLRAAAIFGEDFHELPWAQNVLKLTVSASAKALLLQDAVTEQLEKEANNQIKIREKNRKNLAEKFASNKAKYLLSFNFFYGLNLVGLTDAKNWLIAMANQAFTYDIDSEFMLGSYLEIAMKFGLGFDQENWAKEVLQSDTHPQHKVKELLSHLQKSLAGQQV